jgi:hypothetical protein
MHINIQHLKCTGQMVPDDVNRTNKCTWVKYALLNGKSLLTFMLKSNENTVIEICWNNINSNIKCVDRLQNSSGQCWHSANSVEEQMIRSLFSVSLIWKKQILSRSNRQYLSEVWFNVFNVLSREIIIIKGNGVMPCKYIDKNT